MGKAYDDVVVVHSLLSHILILSNRYLSGGAVNMQQVDVYTRHAPQCMPSADDPEGRNAGMAFRRFPDFVSRVSADLVSTLH
jgi:hypothetical protein